jgi:hypothetical protein
LARYGRTCYKNGCHCATDDTYVGQPITARSDIMQEGRNARPPGFDLSQ